VLAALVLLAPLACSTGRYREVEVDLDAGAPARTEHGHADHVLRFAVAAMESPRDTHAGYARLLARVGHELGAEVELVQRRTYSEVNEMLTAGRLDAALVCTGGYLDLLRRAPGAFEIIAIPVVGGQTTYQSLVVVPAASTATSLDDLRGTRFAFTDELSFSGRAYVVRSLGEKGETPERFFGSTLFTHSHDRSIKAVADGLVEGAVVHSLIYRHWVEREPDLASRVRVLVRSPPFGMMPIVASKSMPEAERARLRSVLLALDRDPEAAAAMRFIDIDRFAVAEPGLYDSAAAIVERTR
jgi:phosphonate transport system substrate-binding protein